MARWRLTTAHYLNVPDIEWEYRETSRATGRQARKIFPVPLYLDPKDMADHNYPGEIIVCYEGKGQGRDIVFFGPPTPDMEPLDDEAEALTKAESHKWVHPIESLPGSFSESLLADFQRQLDAAVKKSGIPKAAAPISESMVSKADFEALQSQVKELMEQNAKLQAGQITRRA